MAKVTTGKVLKYTLMPGILPRMKNLFGTGFSSLSLLMAQIFATAGLLPRNHPYLNLANQGRFGIRHVIAQAAHNLEFNRRNIDKILIFMAILAAAIIMLIQFVLLVVMLFGQSAWAFSMPAGIFFDTEHADTDLAFEILTQVFGVPGIFCSPSTAACSASNATVPWPIHVGLHELLRFYSFGLLLIGVLIFMYFVVVVVAETAVTGHPFGQRFQNVWVPIRLVVALGLLVPINYGLNSGQYITLYSAKLGSSLATNGWLRYNNAIEAHSLFAGGGGAGHNPMGEKETLIGLPQRQSIKEVIEFMSIVQTCAYSYWATRGPGVTPNIPFSGTSTMHAQANIKPYFVKSASISGTVPATSQLVTAGTTLQQAIDFYDYGTIIIRFGEHNDSYQDLGNVKPFCGDIAIPVTTANHIGDFASAGGGAHVMNTYLQLVKNLWFMPNTGAVNLYAGAIYFYENTAMLADRATRVCGGGPANCGGTGLPACGTLGVGSVRACHVAFPSKEWGEDTNDTLQGIIDGQIINAWSLYAQNTSDMEIEDEILERGWAGAGMWFNRIAYMNGMFSESVSGVPYVKQYPEVMEIVKNYRMTNNAEISGANAFDPNLANGTSVPIPGGQQEVTRATALNHTYKTWNQDGQIGSDPQDEMIRNVFMDAMAVVLGVEGLFDMRGSNVHVHPLSQLVMVGKGMVERTIKNMGMAAVGSFLQGIAGDTPSGSIMGAIAGFFSSTAFLGLTAGIILFYIVPFLPFVYFFFTVGTWVKTIFEAMVGVPLWALAHLRLDGEGLPGEAAANGYYLLLEIFVRPILTVFGLVAAIIIFTAQVRVLNFVWDLVVENASGFTDTSQLALDGAYDARQYASKRGVLDQFFFTVIYTIIVYMLATAAFKLIDGIPDHMLRWTGAGVSAFGDQNPDALQDLSRYVATAGMVQGQQLSGAITQGSRGVGGLVGSLVD